MMDLYASCYIKYFILESTLNTSCVGFGLHSISKLYGLLRFSFLQIWSFNDVYASIRLPLVVSLARSPIAVASAEEEDYPMFIPTSIASSEMYILPWQGRAVSILGFYRNHTVARLLCRCCCVLPPRFAAVIPSAAIAECLGTDFLFAAYALPPSVWDNKEKAG